MRPPVSFLSRLPALPAAFAALAVAATLLPATPAAAQGAVVTTPQVRAELVAHAPEGIAAGKPLELALRIEHQPHWHTYWKNPGDSGLPTTLNWTLPDGVQAGDVQWPTPKKLPLGPLVNFGFEDVLLLPVKVQLPAGFSAPTLDVKLAAEWLVCKDVCIPESGEFALSLATGTPQVAHAEDFAKLRDTLPVSLPGAQARAEVRDDAGGPVLVVSVEGLPASWQGREVAFFPETVGVILNAGKPVER